MKLLYVLIKVKTTLRVHGFGLSARGHFTKAVPLSSNWDQILVSSLIIDICTHEFMSEQHLFISITAKIMINQKSTNLHMAQL